MRFAVSLKRAEQLAGHLLKLAGVIAPAASAAAAHAFAETLEQTGVVAELASPLERSVTPRGRGVGTDDPAAVAHELGTLDADPTPWLAPSIPAARGPMRAAVATAVARAISSFRPKAGS